MRTFITYFLLFLSLPGLYAQNGFEWQKVPTPVVSDIHDIHVVNDTLYILQDKMLYYCNHQLKILPSASGFRPFRSFVVNAHSIFASENTSYQNSRLYHFNGTVWNEIQNPAINTIADFCFIDEHNGYMTGYGEILRLENNQWEHLPTPYNGNFTSVAVQKDGTAYFLALNKGVYSYNGNFRHIENSENVHRLFQVHDSIFVIGNDFAGFIQGHRIEIISHNNLWSGIRSFISYRHRILGVGAYGLFAVFDKDTLLTETHISRYNLYKIIRYGQELWVAGANGEVLRYAENNAPLESPVFIKGFKRIQLKQKAKIVDDEYGVIAADFNRDGRTDIYTCGLFENDHLYINNGNMAFSNQAEHFLPESSRGKEMLNLGACAADFDNDGYIDLYLGVLNGKNIFFKNIKGKRMVDYSGISGGTGETGDRTNAVIAGDVDNDGDLDIFITNEFSSNRLFLNNGVGIFHEYTSPAGLSTEQGGNSASFSDFDLDGDIDLFVTTWSGKNILYRNLFTEQGKVLFENITEQAGVGGRAFEKTNAVVWKDFNHDAYPDLFITNRKTANVLYINNKDGTFSVSNNYHDSLRDAAYGAAVSDFNGDFENEIYVLNLQNNLFYVKDTTGSYADRTEAYNAGISGYSTGVALSDLDNDGDIDMYVADYIGSGSSILQNNADSGKFFTLTLNAYRNNRNGIGSKIFVYRDSAYRDLAYYDEVIGGGSYVSMDDTKRIIPAGDLPLVYLKIVFPDGTIRQLKAEAGKDYSVTDTGDKNKRLFIRYIRAQIFDPHRLFSWIKWIFVILLSLWVFRLGKNRFQINTKLSFFTGLLIFLLYFIQYRRFEYDGFFYATLLPVSSVILLSLLFYFYFERKIIKENAIKKQAEIKNKLSRNLHDDLAATISSIGFYLTFVRYNLKDKSSQVMQHIEKAEELIKEATGSIADLIWSIQPKPASLEQLLNRLTGNYHPIFKSRNISFILRKEAQISGVVLPENQKQNLYLILKEALHNILKYAQASQVIIRISKNDKKLHITVEDDGTGFDLIHAREKGNGLKNMQSRAKEMNATLQIISHIDQGTKIHLEFTPVEK